jgi:hypothetical protein
MKVRTGAVCCFWRACVRQDKPARERHDLVFVFIEFVFLCCGQLAPAFTLKARIVITNLFQESNRVQRVDREPRQIPRDPAILHLVALSGVLALRSPLGLVDAVPPRHVQVSKLSVPRGTDRGGTCQQRDNDCRAKGGHDFHSRRLDSLPLVQPQLVVGTLASVVVIGGAPFDVQDSIRRNAGNRGVDATGATGVSRAARVCICALVVPVREDGEVVAEPRQANVSPGVIRCRKLRIAVGRQIDRVELLVVQGAREWQRNGGDRIIFVIADVGSPWHATPLYLSYHVLADARCRCWGWAACSGIEATRHIRVLVAVRPDVGPACRGDARVIACEGG